MTFDVNAYDPLIADEERRTFQLRARDEKTYLIFPLITIYCDLNRYTVHDADIIQMIERRYRQKIENYNDHVSSTNELHAEEALSNVRYLEELLSNRVHFTVRLEHHSE